MRRISNFPYAVIAVFLTVALPPRANAQTGINENAINRCRAMTDDAARLRCYENNLSDQSRSGTSRMQPLGKWRLVRTPNPQGGKEAISIMRAAELSGSDPDFAGLMLRCADTGIDVLVVLIAPLPPRAHPKISIGGMTFDGSVTPPGAAILLPATASDLASSKWQTLAKLNIEVSDESKVVKGLVEIDGLANAMQTLAATCAIR
jgi:hypothetical protein